ncbi:MAG: hypothetical protein HQK61_08980 [Desulfamplus sp.]|nr:hypothetical protein [Desulfamplus sp.]
MIAGINMTGSSIYHQRQISSAKDATPLVHSTETSTANTNADYKVDLNAETNKIRQEYSAKQTSLKKEHETKIKQLESQYNREQNQIEQEYTTKKRALRLNVYA